MTSLSHQFSIGFNGGAFFDSGEIMFSLKSQTSLRSSTIAGHPSYTSLQHEDMKCGADTFSYSDMKDYLVPNLPEVSPSIRHLRLDYLLSTMGTNDRMGTDSLLF